MNLILPCSICVEYGRIFYLPIRDFMMKRLKVSFLLFFFICVSVCLPLAGFSQDFTVADALKGLEKKYTGKSFKAHFHQTTNLAALDINDTSSGQVWFSHPGKMRWQYILPRPYVFITNGQTIWFYQPRENQISVGNAGDFFKAGAGGTFLSDFSQVRENYSSRLKTVSVNDYTLELTPKKAVPEVALIEIKAHRPSHEIYQVITQNIHSDTTTFDFTDTRFVSPDPDLFEFIIPEGISVIEMD